MSGMHLGADKMNKVVLYVAGVNGFEWKYPDQVILVRYIIRRSGTFKRVEPRIYSVSLFRDGVFCIIENFDGILYDIKSPVNYILYIGGLEIMMGFREFAKSQYDTIKLETLR